MLLKCCTQYASKFGILSSGHRTGKGQFLFQSQRKAMPKNVHIATQLDSFHMLASEWVCVCKSLSRVRLFATPWTILSMELSRPEYRSGYPFPSLGDLPYPRIKPRSSALPADSLPAEPQSNVSKVMFKILQARLQQYVNWELPDVQAGFRKGRGTRDQIASIHWIMEKAREFQKNICFIDNAKALDSVDHSKLENSSRDGNTGPSHLPPVKPVCRSRSNS